MAERRRKEDKELEQYRRLMEPPEEFEDGFSWKTVAGAIFLGALMMPGSMFLFLFMGHDSSMLNASRWVTIILFAEVARRSLKDLKMQEVYVLYYMAGVAMMAPFQGLLWNQFFVRSEYAQGMGIAQSVPTWWAPSAEAIKEAGPTFFHKIWLGPILFTSFAVLIAQLDQFGLGYVWYRVTSDVEELPFPMAPVAASGITALTEEKGNKQEWRWRCFSIGGMVGIVFGAFYIGLPAVTGAFLAKPLQLIPLPWVDYTAAVSKVLPATPFNIQFNAGLVFVGMVLPFWAVVGGFLAVVIKMILNPVLYHTGVLVTWNPQMDVVDTIFANNIDFYLSFGTGLTLAIVFVSLGQCIRPIISYFRTKNRNSGSDLSASKLGERRPSAWERLVTNNVKRGDFSIFLALGIYVFTSTAWIGVSAWLIEGFPVKFFVIYAVVIVPLISYATAKLEGLAGQVLPLPMMREATYILSGYQGVAIWFAPVPIPISYGLAVVQFRTLELTGTKIISKVKTLIVTIPIVILSSLLFSQFLWQMAPVPSETYPYAQKMWDLQAKNMCLMYSATAEGGSLFMEAWKWSYFTYGTVTGTLTFMILSAFGLPTLLVFGLVRGLGQGTPANLILEMVGAVIGRFYFRKRFGDMWLRYTPVMLAGFSCGMGLVAMVSVGFTILTKMMSPLLF